MNALNNLNLQSTTVRSPTPTIFPPEPPDPQHALIQQAPCAQHTLTALNGPASLLKLKCTIDDGQECVDALIDSGATTNFISSDCVKKHKLTITKTQVTPITLGNNSVCRTDEQVDIRLALTNGPVLNVVCLVLPLSAPIILGINFLRTHNPLVDWKANTITFGNKLEHMKKRKRKTRSPVGPVSNSLSVCSVPSVLSTLSFTSVQSAAPDNAAAQPPELPTVSTVIWPATMPFAVPATTVVFRSRRSALPRSSHPVTCAPSDLVYSNLFTPSSPSIYLSSMEERIQQREVDCAVLSYEELNLMIKNDKKDIEQLFLCNITNTGELSTEATQEDECMPALRKKYASVFSTDATFPPSRPQHDHAIPLVPGAQPVSKPHYRLSTSELDELQKQIKDLMSKGFIRPSTSAFGAPVLFVKKKDGALRLCVDYRQLNDITIKNRYPLPRIDELIGRLQGATYFSKIDLKSGYHQLQVKEEDRHKTAFRTRYGSYEFTVMSFGLTNAPSSFMALMHDVLKGLVDKTIVVYLDDIIIFSKGNKEEHQAKVEEVLQRLQEHSLVVNQAKCSFFQSSVDFLGFHVGRDGVKMEAAKVKGIMDLAPPTTKKQLRCFLGMIGFYRDFIDSFSVVSSPLSDLLQDKQIWEWNENRQAAFEKMKILLMSAPVLMLPDDTRPFIVNTDASSVGVGAVLQQIDTNGKLRPCAYFSKKLQPAETRYSTHEQEMLAIMLALKHWRHFLYRRPFTIRTDHRSLEHFLTQPQLNNRQRRWAEVLADYDFQIEYESGDTNTVADTLSRNPLFDDGQRLEQVNSIGTGTRFRNPLYDEKKHSLNSVSSATSNDIITQLKDAGARDVEYTELLNGAQRDGFRVVGGLVYFHSRVVIPSSATALQTTLLSECHETLVGGHYGVAKTAELISRHYYWKHMNKSVVCFVDTCITCTRSKATNSLSPGLLQPIEIPERRWSVVTLDFIGPLPMTIRGNNAVFTVVDKLSKTTYFIAFNMSSSAVDIATLFFDNVVRLHGLPTTIISDRDVRFTATFWKTLWTRLGTRLAMSTAWHPQTDGQSERANRTVQQYVRAFVNYKQDDWDTLLSTAELSYNNTVNPTTGYTPAFLQSGQHPRLPVSIGAESICETAEDMLKQLFEALDKCEKNSAQAQQKQKYQADKYRKDMQYKVGDKVMLRANHLKHDFLTGKLTPKYIGPYEITAKIGAVAYQVQLPLSMSRTHNNFHVSRLRKFTPSPPHFSSRIAVSPSEPPAELLDDGTEVWEVEKIMNKRTKRYGRGSRVEYLVKWKHTAVESSTWEPKKNLIDCQWSIDEFERQQLLSQ